VGIKRHRTIHAAVGAILAVGVVCAAKSDDWPAFVSKTAVSQNGQLLVRVDPGNSLGDVYGFAGEPIGAYATGHMYYYSDSIDSYQKLRQISLANPIGPVDVLVNNEGWIVTLDNWHNMGYGEIIVVYDNAGIKRQSYTLDAIYDAEAEGKFERSVSSIWWRCGAMLPIINGERLVLWDALGGRLTVEFTKGKLEQSETAKTCPQ
jgi:hypothetical protein